MGLRSLGWVGLVVALAGGARASDFKEKQREYPHVREAYDQKEIAVRQLFEEAGLSFPPYRIFWRAFKKEKVLELWVQEEAEPDYVRVKDFPIRGLSGILGPKRIDGDRQVPEGFYKISEFYPGSEHYLGLRLDYPNRSDTILGDPVNPGKEILIHGGYESTGCLAMTNDGIREIYVITLEAYVNGQEDLPVHIFPTRLDEENLEWLFRQEGVTAGLRAFWGDLSEGYRFFEGRWELPVVRVDRHGAYLFLEE